MQSGLEDYYQHRTENASPQSVPDSAEFLALYDRPDIKKSFVIDHDGVEEACLLLEDIHCSACVWLNEHHLRKLDGVISATIDSVTHRAIVRWDPDIISLSKILLTILNIGYHAHPYDPAKNDQQLADRKLKSTERLLFSGIFGMFVMQFALATYFMGSSGTGEPLQLWEIGGRWVSLLICSLLLAYPAQTFFVSAWRAIRHGQVNMDVPIVIGLSAAFLGSAYATIVQSGEVYFEAIAMFVFFVLLSRRWELKGQLYASRFLSRLNKQKLQTAERISTDGKGEAEIVSVNDLIAGDRVSVLPGSSIPVDGRLMNESAELDESLLTGESLPQTRKRGDNICAGSINGDQRIVLEVEHEAAFSTVEEINRLILRGIENKPREEIIINRIASRFIAALLIVTAATLSYWLWRGDPQWLSNTIAVLIVTCPCALALAIPVANSIATGRLLESGVLPLDMNALPALAKSDTVIFDKTGTLTAASLTVVDVWLNPQQKNEKTLTAVIKLASQSEHPVSRAIVDRYGVDQTEFDIVNLPGQGLQGKIKGRNYRLGAIDFAIKTENKQLPAELLDTLKHWHSEGYQITAFSEESELQGLFACSNPVRPGIRRLLEKLKSLGVKETLVVSGDHEQNVERLAKSLGISSHASRQTPEDKLKVINTLRSSGKKVVMVGDGINDAPILAAADASISLGSATDLAKINSDFVLLNNNLFNIAIIKKVAQKTRKVIGQNIFWAVSYNAILVPAAAAGFVQPWLAALGMSLSSLIVVSNSLRLRKINLG